MRVLLTHERFAPDFGGGAEVLVLECARWLERLGARVEVLTRGDPAITAFDGVATRRLRLPRYAFNLAVPPIARAARDADVVLTFTYHAAWPSLVAARRARIPAVLAVVALFASAWREMRGPALGRAWEAWERRLLRAPFDRLAFLSEFSRSVGVGLGADPARTAIVPAGIEPWRYRADAARDTDVLFVGKLEARKGVDDVLAVAAAIPHVTVRCVGWGTARDEARYRRAAPPNVRFVPFERGDALRAEFARSRVFLFPSRAETFGIALAEAMASGCAVVSSIPFGHAGATVAPGDVRAMTAAVTALLADEGARAEAGATNRVRAQDYTWERHGRAMLAVLEDALRARASGAAPTLAAATSR